MIKKSENLIDASWARRGNEIAPRPGCLVPRGKVSSPPQPLTSGLGENLGAPLGARWGSPRGVEAKRTLFSIIYLC